MPKPTQAVSSAFLHGSGSYSIGRPDRMVRTYLVIWSKFLFNCTFCNLLILLFCDKFPKSKIQMFSGCLKYDHTQVQSLFRSLSLTQFVFQPTTPPAAMQLLLNPVLHPGRANQDRIGICNRLAILIPVKSAFRMCYQARASQNSL